MQSQETHEIHGRPSLGDFQQSSVGVIEHDNTALSVGLCVILNRQEYGRRVGLKYYRGTVHEIK